MTCHNYCALFSRAFYVRHKRGGAPLNKEPLNQPIELSGVYKYCFCDSARGRHPISEISKRNNRKRTTSTFTVISILPSCSSSLQSAAPSQAASSSCSHAAKRGSTAPRSGAEQWLSLPCKAALRTEQAASSSCSHAAKRGSTAPRSRLSYTWRGL